jgi:RNA polymerase sigma-54 factor
MLLQSQSPSLRPLTTAHLATTMSLMSLTAAELRQRIESELASNPALELAAGPRCPSCGRPLAETGPCPFCSRPQNTSSEEPIVFVSPREDFYTSTSRISPEDMPGDETTAESEDLPTYVLRQIAPDLAQEDWLLAAHLLTSLDEDGLLRTPLVEFARYHHVPISRIEKVISIIQRADPVGVGSTGPQEALLVQLEILAESKPVPALAEKAIREGWDLLSRRHFLELGKLLKVSTAQAKEIAHFIGENLNPYPARSHWGNIHQGTEAAPDVYNFPDILISHLGQEKNGPLVVEVVSPMAGKLRLNPLFRQSLQLAPPDKAEEWQNDLEQASLLIKCLQQRNHTIVRLMQRITSIQRRFILLGDAHLEPITRASLANELGVHESTISRAVSGKAVQLPNGKIVPLAKMFDRSLHIRTVLRQIITEESKPLTDTELAALLKKKGYKVARRTVAKYRAMEGILPAHLRQSIHAISP